MKNQDINEQAEPGAAGYDISRTDPAVLAFNAFTRANRLELSELDAFAHDLHAWLTTGTRLASTPIGEAQPQDDTHRATPSARALSQGA